MLSFLRRRRRAATRAQPFPEAWSTSPAEFFAVVTEAFFETPRRLERTHPELYRQLVAFYQQDPARNLPGG